MLDILSWRDLSRVSPVVIERLQNVRLRAAVRYLVPHTPFYAERLSKNDLRRVRCVEDWEKLGFPLVRKVDYMSCPEDFVVAPEKREAFFAFWRYHTYLEPITSLSVAFRALFGRRALKEQVKNFFVPKMPLFSGGTEYGSPVPVFLSAEQKEKLKSMVGMLARGLSRSISGKGSSVGMNLFPYGPHLAWHASHEALDAVVDLNLCTAGGGAISTERLVQLAGVFKPSVFTGMAEYFRHKFIEECRRQKVRLPREVLFVHGATGLLDVEKRLLKSAGKSVGVSKMSVLNVFGASELKTALLPECREGFGFHHVNPLSAIIRTVDVVSVDDWKFSQDGDLVVWSIDGAGTLLLGYVLGDSAERVEQGVCSGCGVRVQRFFGVSRVRDVSAQLRLTGLVEEKVKGARINLVKVRERVLSVKGVNECQVVVDRKKGRVTVLFSADSSVDKKVRQALAGLEVKPAFQHVSLKSLIDQSGFKFRTVVVK